MEDKENQIIEKLANDIYSLKSCDTSFEENCKLLAYDLVTLGWIKLPEDIVVISKREYDSLRCYKIKVETTCISFTIKEWEDFCDGDGELPKTVIIRAKEQERKETAEKILNEIYAVLWDEKTPIADSFVNLDVKIREIATREGVEIKE